MTNRKGKLEPLILIDDDELSHVIFKTMMKIHYGKIPVIGYTKPLEIINQIANNAFSAAVIILDINMPVMSGWDFLSRLEALNIDIPVYMLSSSDDPRDMNRAKKFKNVAGYFIKPLQVSDLDQIIKKTFHDG